MCGTPGVSAEVYSLWSVRRLPWRDVDKDKASNRLELLVFRLQSDSDNESELWKINQDLILKEIAKISTAATIISVPHMALVMTSRSHTIQ